jgi:hypothetical protein
MGKFWNTVTSKYLVYFYKNIYNSSIKEIIRPNRDPTEQSQKYNNGIDLPTLSQLLTQSQGTVNTTTKTKID